MELRHKCFFCNGGGGRIYLLYGGDASVFGMPRSECGQGVGAPRSTRHEIPASSRTKPDLEEWQETGVAWINARSVMFAGSIGMTLMWPGLSLGWRPCPAYSWFGASKAQSKEHQGEKSCCRACGQSIVSHPLSQSPCENRALQVVRAGMQDEAWGVHACTCKRGFSCSIRNGCNV